MKPVFIIDTIRRKYRPFIEVIKYSSSDFISALSTVNTVEIDYVAVK